MKYTVEVEIDKPIDEVVILFDNPDNMSKWMTGLISIEQIKGELGEVGSSCNLKFKIGKREIDMLETIISKNLPYEMTSSYDANGAFSIVKSKFIELPNNRTKYISENKFEFNGLIMKFFGFFMPWIFRRQSLRYLTDFKNFAENL